MNNFVIHKKNYKSRCLNCSTRENDKTIIKINESKQPNKILIPLNKDNNIIHFFPNLKQINDK